MTSSSDISAAMMMIACFCARAIKNTKYVNNLADVIYAEWEKEKIAERRKMWEEHHRRKALVMTLSASLKRNKAVREYDASRPERIIQSYFLRRTVQEMYLKKRAAATLWKYFKSKNAEREIWEYESDLETMVRLHQTICVMPDHLTSIYNRLMSRFN
jgi:hypothetical protein